MPYPIVLQLEEVADILGTILFYFALIVFFALLFGAIIFFLKVYLITEAVKGLKGRPAPQVMLCPYCGHPIVPNSAFCSNCGRRFR